MSVVKQTLGEAETSAKMDLNEDVNQELLYLVDVLLHASYQFAFLTSVGERLPTYANSWERDIRCRESAVKIMNWIQENNGYLELADISKPRFNDSKLDEKFFFARWAKVEKSIDERFVAIKRKINHYEKKTELKSLLKTLRMYILD